MLLLPIGLVALVGGGYLIVEGASSLAQALGVPRLIVGLTVVAFGTSAPELAVNLAAGIAGTSALAFGNVVGSNIANIGLILGISAVVRTLDIQSQLISREIPMMLLATAAVIVMALDGPLSGRPAVYDRGDGILLLLLFAVFLYGMARAVLRLRKDDHFVDRSIDLVPVEARRPILLGVVMSVAGLGVLVAGGELAVRGATALAMSAGVPMSIIGATVVAVGTSLPELVTSFVAAVRREADIAVGNIVGSNIFNLLFVLGTTAVVLPTPVPASGHFELVALALLSVLLFLFAITQGRRIVRTEGAILLTLWASFVVFGFLGLGW